MAIKYVEEKKHPKNNCRLFRVVFDGEDEIAAQPMILLEDKRLPQLLEEHPLDHGVFVLKRKYRAFNPTSFEIEVEYGISDPQSVLIVKTDNSLRKFLGGVTNKPNRLKTLIKRMILWFLEES
jgi:hypothetical protein